MPTFVFDAMDEVLLKTVLKHLNEVVGFDLLMCVVIVLVTFRSSRFSNRTTNLTQRSSLRS